MIIDRHLKTMDASHHVLTSLIDQSHLQSSIRLDPPPLICFTLFHFIYTRNHVVCTSRFATAIRYSPLCSCHHKVILLQAIKLANIKPKMKGELVTMHSNCMIKCCNSRTTPLLKNHLIWILFVMLDNKNDEDKFLISSRFL